jgi:hypothetical protein
VRAELGDAPVERDGVRIKQRRDVPARRAAVLRAAMTSRISASLRPAVCAAFTNRSRSTTDTSSSQ